MKVYVKMLTLHSIKIIVLLGFVTSALSEDATGDSTGQLDPKIRALCSQLGFSEEAALPSKVTNDRCRLTCANKAGYKFKQFALDDRTCGINNEGKCKFGRCYMDAKPPELSSTTSVGQYVAAKFDFIKIHYLSTKHPDKIKLELVYEDGPASSVSYRPMQVICHSNSLTTPPVAGVYNLGVRCETLPINTQSDLLINILDEGDKLQQSVKQRLGSVLNRGKVSVYLDNQERLELIVTGEVLS